MQGFIIFLIDKRRLSSFSISFYLLNCEGVTLTAEAKVIQLSTAQVFTSFSLEGPSAATHTHINCGHTHTNGGHTHNDCGHTH